MRQRSCGDSQFQSTVEELQHDKVQASVGAELETGAVNTVPNEDPDQLPHHRLGVIVEPCHPRLHIFQGR
ncbi:AMMECR1 domain-containing protein [Arthrobacter sp. UYCu723]